MNRRAPHPKSEIWTSPEGEVKRVLLKAFLYLSLGRDRNLRFRVRGTASPKGTHDE